MPTGLKTPGLSYVKSNPKLVIALFESEERDSKKGRVAYIDSFGNVISDITPSDLKTLQEVTKRTDIAIQVGATTIKGLKTHYGQGSSS